MRTTAGHSPPLFLSIIPAHLVDNEVVVIDFVEKRSAYSSDMWSKSYNFVSKLWIDK